MEINKIEAGCYEVKTNGGTIYKVIKDSYLGGWGIFDNNQTTYNHLLITKNTKKECLDFIEGNFKDLTHINDIPNIKINSHFRVMSDTTDTVWNINDILYSTAKGKWIVHSSYYNNSIDCGERDWDIDDFNDLCEEYYK
jgi:hypothetical protein